MPQFAVAAVAAAATIGGAAISSHSSNKAANQARDTELQVAQQNNALVRENRDFLSQRLDPYVQSGLRSSNLIDSFLFGPSQQPQATYAPATAGSTYAYAAPGGYGGGNGAGAGFQYERPIDGLSLGDEYGQGGFGQPPVIDRNATYGGGPNANMSFNGSIPASVPTNALSGWDAFVASPYYQNPLREGYRALNHGLASGGMLFSGDAAKRALRYGSDYNAGRQDEFLGLAGQQAGRGLAAGSALGGVTQNALAMTTQNNSNAADAVANAALLRAQNNNALIGSIGGALGTVAGSFPSSYRK